MYFQMLRLNLCFLYHILYLSGLICFEILVHLFTFARVLEDLLRNNSHVGHRKFFALKPLFYHNKINFYKSHSIDTHGFYPWVSINKIVPMIDIVDDDFEKELNNFSDIKIGRLM